MSTKVRNARIINMKMQKQLIELMSGKKISVNFPDKLNPVLVEITSRDDQDVSVLEIIDFLSGSES